MVQLNNSFEGIPSGTAVTTLNSGTDGQSAFDAVAGSVVASTDSAVIGAKGLRATLATSTQSYVAWTVSGLTHHMRAYVRTPAANAINSRLMWSGTAGDTLLGWDVREVVATDKIGFATRNTLRFSLGSDGVDAPLAPNTVYRVEAKVVTGATGTAEVRLYSAAGALLDSGTFAGVIDPVTSLQYGIGNGVNASTVWDLDAIGYSDTDFLGPAGTPGAFGDTLTYSLNRLAGTLVNGVPTLADQGAANVWAGTTGLGIAGALNVKAGNTLPNYATVTGALNQIAETTGLTATDAAWRITA